MSDEKPQGSEEKSADSTQQPSVQQQIEPGECGKFLNEHGINFEPLGNDNSGIETIELSANNLIATCELLKKSNEISFDSLNLITTVDLKKGYQSVYLFESFTTKKVLRIKVTLSKDKPIIPTVSHLWKSAVWYEREAFDMMGIIYTGHPNLKRILNPDNWEGHPLRKDYIPPSDSLNGPHPLNETDYAERTLQLEKTK